MNQKKRSLTGWLKLYFCGFIMGAADVVPGVSGGTMAFILGIYQELLDSIRGILSPETVKMALGFKIGKMWKELPWRFLAVLGIGILSAIVSLSSPLKWMLENRLVLILAFFFGLVLGSVITVWGKVKKWCWNRYLALLTGGIAGFLIVGLPMLKNPPDSLWYLLLCGAIAICAMILPGISGSFMLLLMGKYELVLNAVHQLKQGVEAFRNLTILVVFGIGVVIGISSFVRLLSYLLRKFNDITVAVLIGFMIGSLRKVWPWKVDNRIENINILPASWDSEFWTAAALAVFGLVLVLVIEFAARKLEEKSPELK